MKKSLVAILNYNTPHYTDSLYESLKPFEREDYSLFVVDNGSLPQGKSRYTSLELDHNVYYGGGLDATLTYLLETDYDSVMLLNSDLVLHGTYFVQKLREALFSKEDYVVMSGCVLQPEKNQCHWRMVHNWGSTNIREVPWVDYQCALLKRSFVEKIEGGFGSRFGWVQDVMTGIVCEECNWKIGVCDWLPVVHFGNATVRLHQEDPIIKDYNKLAEQEMISYFQSRGLWDKFIEMRQKAENYGYR